MLQGILTQCCFPQLSYLSNAVRDLIRIDFFTALPNEISFKILSYLDTTSLCKAAQVSQRWRKLADDDLVWHKMCEQHIDRKCTKCGWGLPLLERRRLRDWKRQQQLRGVGRGLNEWSPNLTPMPEETGSTKMIRTSSNGSSKRDITNFLADGLPSSSPETSKRPCTNGVNGEQSLALAQPKFRPWKEVYKDRFKVGTNWKYGRYSTKVFRGHTNGIMCLQFDDNILATGSYDTTIKIWDINTGECLRTLRGHAVGVRALQFDDTKLISGSLDKKVKVWNWRTGECISTYEGGSMGIISVNFDGNLLASGSIDKSVKIWNFEDKSTFCLRGHKDWINAVRVDAESRTVFSASDDCTVRLWDLDTRRTIRTFEGHVGQVQQLILLPAEYEPDDPDAYEEIDDAASSTNSQASDQYTPPPPENTNTFADWPDSRPRPAKYMLTGGLDSTIRLWSVETGRCLKTFFGHVEGIWALAGDTLRFVSGAEDRMVKVWDARSGKCERTITGHAGPVTCLGLSDSRLVSGSEDCEVRVLDFRTEQGGDTNATTSASVVCTPAV
jgi:F-box/WD-40 domain protein MET30